MYPTFPKGKGTTPLELANQTIAAPLMYPYPNGIVLFGQRYLGHILEHGDIVSFRNSTTESLTQAIYSRPSGLIKRVIALPGDTIELRDGLVYLNGNYLSEPYIAKSRSTFGADTLKECQPLTIPDGKIFVMGDNRTGSGDSRADLGLVSISDIDHVIPLSNQTGPLTINWRDTSQDQNPNQNIQPDLQSYLDLVNSLRKELGLKPLSHNPKLDKSSRFSALSYFPGPMESMETVFAKAGYSNIATAQIWIVGHFTADELFESQLESPKSKSYLTSSRYQELGLFTVNGQLANCPTQITVIHLGGYVPPNYSPELVRSWADALSQLQQVQPTWQSLSTSSLYSQNSQLIDQINSLISLRVNRLSAIVTRMKNNQWLTKEEKTWADADSKLSEQIYNLVSQLKP